MVRLLDKEDWLHKVAQLSHFLLKDRRLPVNLQLILTKLHRFLAISLVLASVASPSPVFADLGLLSFVAGVFGNSANAQESARTYTHQESFLLAAAINPDPNPAKGGGDIVIEGDALVSAISPDSLALGEVRNSSDQIARYVVRKGDNLSSIAKMFDVSVNTIRWSNDISRSGVIHEGQELVILPIDGVRYTVKKGDTIKSIARSFKGDVEEILNFNGLSLTDDLSIGRVVVIPDGVVTPPPALRVSSTNRVAQYSGPAIVGYFLRPVSGARTQGLHGNNGVDMAASTGTAVFAAAAGEVLIARSTGWNGGYGKMIVISHQNGTQTLYAHLSQIDVVPGEVVAQGERIGAAGNTGRSTGPHLHFEVRGAANPF